MNAVSKVNEDGATTVDAGVETQAATTPQPAAAPAPKQRRKRGPGRFLIMAALPLALIVGGGYVWVNGGRYQETENANLRQARVNIASEIAGRIVKLDIADNASVKAGDELFLSLIHIS